MARRDCIISPYRPNGMGVPTKKIRGKTFTHARVVYELHHTHIPKGLQINHHCDESRCINPDHLYAGTQKQNIQDAWRRGRAIIPAYNTHCRAD